MIVMQRRRAHCLVCNAAISSGARKYRAWLRAPCTPKLPDDQYKSIAIRLMSSPRSSHAQTTDSTLAFSVLSKPSFWNLSLQGAG